METPMTAPRIPIVVLPLVVGFALACGACQPKHSDAAAAGRIHAPEAAAPAAAENLVIVRLVGRHYTVTASSGAHGVVYSAAGADGRAIVANASLDELRLRHPEIYQQLIPGIAEHGEGSNSNRRSASEAQDVTPDAVPTADRQGPRADMIMLMSAE